MNVEGLNWDENKGEISWRYQGKGLVVPYPKVSYASANELNDLLLVIVREKFETIRMAYFNFEGEKVFETDFKLKEVAWVNHKQEWLIKKLDSLKIAGYYQKNDLILVGVGEGAFPDKLLGFSLDGELLFENDPPVEKAAFWYFGNRKQTPQVACLTSGTTPGIERRV